MIRRAAAIAFLESREGFGWIVIVTFATILAVIAGCGFYKVSLDAYVASKNDEKGTALELVDAFVSNYSNLRLQLGGDNAPVPATFRAHSIELFNKTHGAANSLRLHWIGRADRSIATPPADAKMAATIESFVGRADPAPVSQFVAVGGEQVFRTVYPSVARERSCVDCHNKLQPDLHWQLNDVMGAFSLDATVGEFVHDLRWEATIIALAIFVLFSGVGFWMSLSHYRRIREREAAREHAVSANQAGAFFLANISHQLHTPLKAIIRFSEMMLSEILGPLPNDKYRACVADIQSNGAHLLGVINDILDLSQGRGWQARARGEFVRSARHAALGRSCDERSAENRRRHSEYGAAEGAAGIARRSGQDPASAVAPRRQGDQIHPIGRRRRADLPRRPRQGARHHGRG